MGLKARPQWIRPRAQWIKGIKKGKKTSLKQGNPSSAKSEENILVYNSFGLGYNFSSCCYNVFSTDFPTSSSWRVSYIIYLPLDDLGPPFVDRPGHYLSACPIRHLPNPLASYDGQGNIVQRSSPHKCS